MAVRADWLGLDDIPDRIGGAARAGDAAAEPSPQVPDAPPSVLVVPIDDAVPFVSRGDDFRLRDDESFVPVTPGKLHATPALVHIQPTAQDFGLSDEVAFISGVYPDGTMPLYAFYAWNNDQPATYTGGFTNTAKWGASTADTPGGTVSYFFTTSSNWSDTEKAFFIAGLTLWSDVTNISFAPAATANLAQIVITRGTDHGAATSPKISDPGGGGETGGSVLLNLVKATISIDTRGNGFGPIQDFNSVGGYPIMTLLHEEGHALGLGHAGPYNGNVDANTQQFSAYDTRLWSIMSYIEPSQAAEFSGEYPVTGTQWSTGSDRRDPTGLMPLDILAAQALYGAPTSTPLSGGQIFGFHANISGPSGRFFDFMQNTTPILTLWDMGTGNALDLSGWSTPSTVNLNPGTFSSADGLTNNLAIAFGTAIDTYVGGGGVDSVIGNNDGDTFTGGGGNDTFTGGTGTDTAVFDGNFSDYTIADLGGGSFRITDNRAGSPDGSDLTNEVELGKFADGTHTLNAAADPTPQLAGGGNTVGFTEQAAAVTVDSGLTLADPGSATIDSAAVTITAGFVAGDVLGFVNQAGIGGTYDAGTHVLTLSGTATVAAYQAALDSVTFSSSSDNPTNFGAAPTRTVQFTATSGGHTGNTVTSTITVTPIDDPATLHNSAFTTAENATVGTGLNVFSNNGAGAASDPDSALAVTAVNGSAANVGHQITLASGALLTLNADGTFLYNPNHVFDYLPAPGSGASDTHATDSFSYSDGGVTATVTMTVTGVDSNDTLTGTSGNDTIDGGAGNDTFVLSAASSAYHVTFDNDAQAFAISGPDGVDTVRNVENFRFADGTYTADTGNHPWALELTTRDGSGSISSQTYITDGGTRWVNAYDTTNAQTWQWLSADYDANGQLVSLTGANDDGTHFLNVFGGGTLTSSLIFDANWNQTGGNIDPAVFDTLLWFTHPYDADLGGAPENLTLAGGSNSDVLYGFGGNDTLNGRGGNDVLAGGAGNDVLTGGAGNDRFIYGFADGQDVITDFAHGDVVEIHGVGNFSDLQALMTQSGADTVIAFDPQDTLTLQNVQMTQLTAGDFILS